MCIPKLTPSSTYMQMVLDKSERVYVYKKKGGG